MFRFKTSRPAESKAKFILSLLAQIKPGDDGSFARRIRYAAKVVLIRATEAHARAECSELCERLFDVSVWWARYGISLQNAAGQNPVKEDKP